MQLLKLCLLYYVGAAGHEAGRGLYLREGYDVAYAGSPGDEHSQPVQTVCKAAVRRSAVLEGAHQEAEALPGLFLGKAQLLKHLLLYLGGVDTYGAAANLVAVEHDIVCFGANLALIGIQQVQIFIHR